MGEWDNKGMPYSPITLFSYHPINPFPINLLHKFFSKKLNFLIIPQ